MMEYDLLIEFNFYKYIVHKSLIQMQLFIFQAENVTCLNKRKNIYIKKYIYILPRIFNDTAINTTCQNIQRREP